jgi:hypothetical protein
MLKDIQISRPCPSLCLVSSSTHFTLRLKKLSCDWTSLIAFHIQFYFNSLVTNQWPQLDVFQCHYHLQTLSSLRKDFCNCTWHNVSHFGFVSRLRKYCFMWSKITFQIISFVLYFAVVQIFT